MEIVNNVTAQEFIQVVFSNRQEQSNVVGNGLVLKKLESKLRLRLKSIWLITRTM